MAELDTSQFSDDEKRAYMLSHHYQTTRQERQKFYKIFPEGIDPRTHPQFKSLVTVAKWLEEEGAKITYRKLDWMLYVQFVFDKLAPTIPQPGQIKNNKIFGEYLRSFKAEKPIGLTTDQLEALYRKKLKPELVKETGIMELLGLRNLDILDPIKWDDPTEIDEQPRPPV